MSLKGFREHPIFGWGPENYNLLFNKYYDPHLYPTESWFDRAHNVYLDVLVHTGIIGFTLYSLIFLGAFWFLWRAWRRQKINYFTAVIFTVILVSYLIQNFFLFDTQVTLLMIYSILAFIIFLSFEEKPKEEFGAPVKTNFFFKALVFVLIFFAMYFINFKPAQTSVIGIDGLSLLQQRDIDGGLAKFKEAYDTNTFGVPEVANRAYDIAIQYSGGTVLSEEEKVKFIDNAILGLKKGLEKEPKNARFMMMLGNLYLLEAQRGNVDFLQDADFILGKAYELTPTRQELLFSLGQLRIYQGRDQEALTLFKEAVDMNDQAVLSHWNYGVIAIAVGQKALGEQEIKKAVELGHSYEAGDIRFLINAYGKINDLPKIVELYQEWAKINPDSAEPWAGLAATYQQLGDKIHAKEAALKAIDLDPSFKTEGEQFIKELGI